METPYVFEEADAGLNRSRTSSESPATTGEGEGLLERICGSLTKVLGKK